MFRFSAPLLPPLLPPLVRALAVAPRSAFLIRDLHDVVELGNIDYAGDGMLESHGFITPNGDGLGFGLEETVLEPGASIFVEHDTHRRCLWIANGEGELELVPNRDARGAGIQYALKPGVCCVLNVNEPHFVSVAADADAPLALVSFWVDAARNPGTADRCDSDDEELARLKARVADLEAELGRRRGIPPDASS